MIQIAVLGYGTVGSGVVEVINTNHDSINKRAENEINIKYVLDLRDFPGDPVEKVLVHDYEVIANDPEVDIVVEVMGGVEPAYTFTKRALEAGKSVCTSNKELVARHGTELLAIAKEHGANYLFEASCGGGIPIIRPLNSSLTADEIDEVTGILNGTTNYILSKMASDGSDFADVLKEAQRLGYAERNPEADVEGYDACRKIAILSSLAYGKEAACLAPCSALQAAGFCAVFPAYCYAIWPSSTSAAFATASSIFSGFFPPACAMFGRPPPPPPTTAATSLISFPACAPFFIASSVTMARRLTLPSFADARTTTPLPSFSFSWSPRSRSPFISTSGTDAARSFTPLTSVTLSITSPSASFASLLFKDSFSAWSAFASACR